MGIGLWTIGKICATPRTRYSVNDVQRRTQFSSTKYVLGYIILNGNLLMQGKKPLSLSKCESVLGITTPGGTSGGAANDAGRGATGSDIPLRGTKPEVAGSRNPQFWSFFANT